MAEPSYMIVSNVVKSIVVNETFYELRINCFESKWNNFHAYYVPYL